MREALIPTAQASEGYVTPVYDPYLLYIYLFIVLLLLGAFLVWMLARKWSWEREFDENRIRKWL